MTFTENQFRLNRLDGGTEQTTTTTKAPTTTTTTTTTAPTTTPEPSESDCGSFIEIYSNEKNSFDGGLRYVHAGYKENNKDVFCYPRNRYN